MGDRAIRWQRGDVKAKLLHTLSSIGAICSAAGGLNLVGVISFLPPKIAAALAIAPPVVAALGHAAMALGDALDDGERNDSFKIRCSAFALIAALLVALACPSCVSATAPDGTVTETPDRGLIDSATETGFRLLDRLLPPPKAAPVAAPVVTPTK